MKVTRAKITALAVTALVLAIAAGVYCLFYIPSYELIDLGSLGGPYGKATAVNNLGQVVGRSGIKGGKDHAFIWDAKNGIRDLGTLGGPRSYAYGINDKGQVVGSADTADGSHHAFIWDPNNGMTDLGTLGGGNSAALALNSKGQVVGYSITAEASKHAFIWEIDSGMTDLGTLYEHSTSVAKGINEKGCVIGQSDLHRAGCYAFYWEESTGMMGIFEPNGPGSYATGINDAGQIVGSIFKPEIQDQVAFVWSKETGLKELNLGKVRSRAIRINNSGQIIGDLATDEFLIFEAKGYSFLRTKPGRVINLDRFGLSEGDRIEAVDLNDHGWIVGQLSDSKGKFYSSILLKPK